MSDDYKLNLYYKQLDTCKDKLERLDRVRAKYFGTMPNLEEIRLILLQDIDKLEKQIGIFNPGKRFQEQDSAEVTQARA